MPAPSQLSIATSSLNRLVKEEGSYHREHEQQRARIAKLEEEQAAGKGDENIEYSIRQEKKALAETEAIFPQLKTKIQDALGKLEGVLEQDKGPGDQSTPEDITKAKEAIAAGLKAIKMIHEVIACLGKRT